MGFQSTPTINVLAVLADARSISGQYPGWKKAAEKAVEWSESRMYSSEECPIVAVYMSDGKSRAVPYTIDSLRADLRNGEGADMKQSRTEHNAGWDYAEWLVKKGEVLPGELVDIDSQISKSTAMPDEDFRDLQRCGIENPNARKYWQGYNDFQRSIRAQLP